jgi:hypothetical protein
VLLAFCSPLPAHADPSMMISGNASGEFSLLGMQMEDIVSMNVDVNYDTMTLTNPRVSPTGLLYQAQAKVVSSVSRSGSIRISVTGGTPIDGHGNIAIIEFDLVSEDYPGRVISAGAYMTTSNGHQLSVPVVIENPPEKKKETPSTDDGQSSSVDGNSGASAQAAIENPPAPQYEPVPRDRSESAGGSSGTAANGGRNTYPTAASSGEPRRRNESDNPARLSGTQAGKQRDNEGCRFLAYKSVLDRIREFTGEKTNKNLLRFFAVDPGRPVRQEPAVALSDGKSTVTVVMELENKGERAPNFLVKGAHCISLEQRDSAWVMKIVPECGVLDASVTAVSDENIVEFPLTLAPPLDIYQKSRTASAEESSIDIYVRLVNDLAKIK